MNSKKLFDILPDFLNCEVQGNDQIVIESIEIDSRKIKANALFVALRGHTVDGHDYIDKAVENGATAILLEEYPRHLDKDVCYVKLTDTSKALGHLASSFFDFPGDHLTVIGITGTNGKTTTATLMYELFQKMNVKCGLISTIKYGFDGYEEASTHTTPDAVTVYRLLAKMKEAGCTHVVMEVSSHALDQGRVNGLDFDVAIFTNLSHDHLGYHGTFLNYIKTKKILFDNLSKDAFALLNEDDPKSEQMSEHCKAQIKTYGLKSMSDYKGRILRNALDGLTLRFNELEWHSPMMGSYNAYNLLAIYSAMECLGYDPNEFMVQMSTLKGVDGRFEVVANRKNKVFGIVDYAHTPDALEKILKNIAELKESDQRVITVVGCGGDRDKTKRPVMAKIGAQWSDQLILTSDNPRTENPVVILDEMESGLTEVDKEKSLRIEDRKQAIKTACMLGSKNAIILVAGKGHEKYQEINGEKLPFDDVKILTTTLLKDIKE